MPQIGDTFLAQFEIVREAQDGELFKGIMLSNPRHNKFWARPVDCPEGPEMLCCFDGHFDVLIQAIQTVNQQKLTVDSSGSRA